jgi:NAD(P)-dependent dehydrogenase (short-subunit alcohol dehydrogenase family)
MAMPDEGMTSVHSGPLHGRSVVVTGASRGIGAACAIACASAGAREVALLSRSATDLDSVAQRIRDAGGAAITRICDVTDVTAIERAFGSLDRVDTLVNCAGTNRPEPFVDVEPTNIDLLWRVNARAVFLCSQAATKRMLEHGGGGVIVNISSQMGHVGASLRTAYCMTKHAVEGLTKALAVELAPRGIRVVSVAPTFVRTEMTATQLDDPTIGPRLLAQIPVGRPALPEEVAAAVVFAASNAASMLTGSSLLLDGGWTAK